MLGSSLRYNIDIYKKEKVIDDDYNTEKVTEILLYQNVKCSVKYDTFSEGEALNAMKNNQKITFKFWYRKGIDEDCIIEFNGAKYNIIGIEPYLKVELKLIAVKI